MDVQNQVVLEVTSSMKQVTKQATTEIELAKTNAETKIKFAQETTAKNLRDATKQLVDDNNTSMSSMKDKFAKKEEEMYFEEKDLKRKHAQSIMQKNKQLTSMKQMAKVQMTEFTSLNSMIQNQKKQQTGLKREVRSGMKSTADIRKLAITSSKNQTKMKCKL